ncbi:MAG: hypothetical protein EXS05_02650 [Planctomycetaceae bacterium]|nr:hypothetical protein [Planctomycetaceae bacterium]
MSWILVAAILSGSPEPVEMQMAARQAAEVLAAVLPTGSLIFSQGDCLAVKVFTASKYTHVGAVIERDGTHFVYDSTGGAGVRKLPLGDYLASQGDARLCVYHPQKPFSAVQIERFGSHLESQVGRPYGIKHHLTGKRSNGLHCAEYVTDALISAELMQARQPPRVSPASLKEGIQQCQLYRPVATMHLELKSPTAPVDSGWCSRVWFDTQECTKGCYRKLKGLFCCK